MREVVGNIGDAYTMRLAVPGGWIYRYGAAAGAPLVFVPGAIGGGGLALNRRVRVALLAEHDNGAFDGAYHAPFTVDGSTRYLPTRWATDDLRKHYYEAHAREGICFGALTGSLFVVLVEGKLVQLPSDAIVDLGAAS